MKQVKHYLLETLSPLHIGSGAEYGALDGVYANQRWYLIDIEQALAQSKLDAGALAYEMQQDGFSWAGWLHKYNIQPQAVAKRSVACPQNPTQTKIRACLRDPYGRPYIPGSTVKGAVRTALLEAIVNDLDENTSRRYARQMTQRDQRSGRTHDKRYVARRVLEKPLLTGDKSPRKNKPGADLDPNYDLLRALHIADSEPIDPARVEVGLVWVYTIRGRSLAQKVEGGGEYKMFAEWLPAGVQTTIEITLDEHLLRDSVRRDLGFSENDGHLVHEFAAHCNMRSKTLIESERDFYQEYQLQPLEQFCKALEKHLEQVESQGGFLLNIGWGGGWETKTVLNPLTEDLDQEYNQIRQTYRLGRRNAPFPKTRRVAFQQNQPYAPLGWIMLTPLEK